MRTVHVHQAGTTLHPNPKRPYWTVRWKSRHHGACNSTSNKGSRERSAREASPAGDKPSAGGQTPGLTWPSCLCQTKLEGLDPLAERAGAGQRSCLPARALAAHAHLEEVLSLLPGIIHYFCGDGLTRAQCDAEVEGLLWPAQDGFQLQVVVERAQVAALEHQAPGALTHFQGLVLKYKISLRGTRGKATELGRDSEFRA